MKNKAKESMLSKGFLYSDVAERAGLSVGSVQHVINGVGGFRKDTVDKVCFVLGEDLRPLIRPNRKPLACPVVTPSGVLMWAVLKEYAEGQGVRYVSAYYVGYGLSRELMRNLKKGSAYLSKSVLAKLGKLSDFPLDKVMAYNKKVRLERALARNG